MKSPPPNISRFQSLAVHFGTSAIFVVFLLIASVYAAVPNLVIVFNLNAIPDRARIPAAVGGWAFSLFGIWLLIRHWPRYWRSIFLRALTWWIHYVTGYQPGAD